ncbi:hypothetical protein BT69DRAFT_1279500 [Atractiella rhizophila]|nr:hypothetical protein BT69DRAFT_1279500 [Atractiella rhizophila]
MNNLLSWEPGIGKATVVECLAQRDTSRDADEVEQPPLQTFPPLRFSPSSSPTTYSIPTLLHLLVQQLYQPPSFRLAEADLEFS